MNKKTVVIAGILIVSLVMLACTLPIFGAQVQQKDVQTISNSVLQTLVAQNQYNQPQPLSNAEIVATSVAQTVVALNAQVQGAAVVPPPVTYVNVAPTATPYPCNSATAVDVTVPDYTNFSLNQTFNKTWRFRNVGVCTWNTGYRLAFYSGNSLNAPAYVYLPYSVAPGGTVDVTVPMQAPASYGTYTGYWGLYTDANYIFGRVWVTITAGVVPIPSTYAVSSVTYAINYLTQAVQCNATQSLTFNIQANITTNGPGTVTYYWVKSVGGNTAPQTLTFGAASTQTVLLSWVFNNIDLPGPTNYSATLYIDTPNHQLFSPMTFQITCTP
jgi:hypothetical protein